MSEPDPPLGGEYLTPQEVAALLRCSARTVARLVAGNPTLPCVRLSAGVLRFPRARLLRWLQQREQGRATTRRRTSDGRPQ